MIILLIEICIAGYATVYNSLAKCVPELVRIASARYAIITAFAVLCNVEAF